MKEEIRHHFVECITVYQADFYRLAYSYVKNEADALDIIQDAIQKALLNLNSIQKPEALKSWFYKIVIRTAIDFLRKNKKLKLVDGETLELISQQHVDCYEDIDLKEALERLPIKYKTIIVLRYFEDLRIDEIAEIIGKTSSTTKTRLYKALQLLRMDIRKEDLFDDK
ncbi:MULTISPECIES: RNA polymerase sigma factor [Listeria]|uniref:RNA polymerase sigma factor n=1 Tax=Listeria TaxID=1637 RepID=UPI000B58757F|nr:MULTISPECIES: RNA polymerase sigma factor [Listeria]